MKKKLNVLERLNLMMILPQEGNFLTLKVLRDLNSILGIGDSEYKEFEIEELVDAEGKKTGSVQWNAKGNEERELEIGEKACDICVEALKKLDSENKLEQKHFSLYTKFVEEKE